MMRRRTSSRKREREAIKSDYFANEFLRPSSQLLFVEKRDEIMVPAALPLITKTWKE